MDFLHKIEKISTKELKSKLDTFKEEINQKLHLWKLQNLVQRDQEMEIVKKKLKDIED